MARFRLTAKHYLNVTIPGRKIIWRYEEVSRDGIANQNEFPVPLYLDPDDQRWYNAPGEIIVATEPSKEHPRDYILHDDPTIDMEPLDEEAEALRESLMHKWTNPIETLPAQGLSAAEQSFMDMMVKTMGQLVPPPSADLKALQATVEAQQAQIAELMSRLDAKPARRA